MLKTHVTLGAHSKALRFTCQDLQPTMRPSMRAQKQPMIISPIKVESTPETFDHHCEHLYVRAVTAADKVKFNIAVGNGWSDRIEKHVFTKAILCEIDEFITEGTRFLAFIEDQMLDLSGVVVDIIDQMSADYEQKFTVLEKPVRRFLGGQPQRL